MILRQSFRPPKRLQTNLRKTTIHGVSSTTKTIPTWKTSPENRNGMTATPSCLVRRPRRLGISATIALESASILSWRAGMPEPRVNSGLAGRLPGNAQSTPTSGRPLKTRTNQSLAISLFRWAGASPPCCLPRKSESSLITGRPRTTNPCRGL